jgi:Icc-related predicted phosphoesterase
MITITHISDTHLQPFPELSEADVLVHTGDALNYGTLSEIEQFRQQLLAVKDKYQKIIYVAGNHDRIFESNPYSAKNFLQQEIDNLVYLHHEPYEFKGYKWFATPYQPFFCNWAFNVKCNLELYEKYLEIPKDTEILLTHCPPDGILDSTMYGNRVGSRALKLALKELPHLKAHMFGHIHYSYGIDFINGVWYSNSATCGENYKPTNEPRVIEIE